MRKQYSQYRCAEGHRLTTLYLRDSKGFYPSGLYFCKIEERVYTEVAKYKQTIRMYKEEQ